MVSASNKKNVVLKAVACKVEKGGMGVKPKKMVAPGIQWISMRTEHSIEHVLLKENYVWDVGEGASNQRISYELTQGILKSLQATSLDIFFLQIKANSPN